MNNSALIRVSRKRTADPHEALLLNYKRAKHANPLVFTLYKAAVEERSEEFDGVRVVDLPMNPVDQVEEMAENPLGFVKDEAVGLVGEVEKDKKKKENDGVVELNGRVLQPAAGPAPPAVSPEEELVFDYYRIQKQAVPDWEKEMEIAGLDVKFANREELNMLNVVEEEDSDRADDDDDSNDEDNWRNDYPDEDSYDDVSDDGDPYGELVAENWHGVGFPEDNLHRRMQNIAINDRYEAYFEGESTDDEANDEW